MICHEFISYTCKYLSISVHCGVIFFLYRFHMSTMLAASLHTESYNIVAELMSETSTCIKAKVYYFGMCINNKYNVNYPFNGVVKR